MYTTKDEVMQYMAAATSGEDWNRHMQEVENANNGNLPACWHEAVISSGLAEQAKHEWGWPKK